MRKTVIVLLFSLPLFTLTGFAGFFPKTVQTSIAKVTKDSVVLNKAFLVKGMSGVVVHRYSDELKAITHRLVQTSATQVSIIEGDIIHHNSLPTINTALKVRDKVIGGYLYHNVLLLAPDAKSYTKVTSQYKKNWIHPDLFALFLANEGDTVPTKENLAKFAKAYQVGLIAIISQGKIKLLDPISGYIISQKTMPSLPKKGQAPFYMRFDKIDAGWFSKNTTENYYTIMGAL
jgi:hypothetical protein